MADQPEESEGPSTTSRSVPVLSDAGGDYVEVTCGVLEGKL